MAVKRALVTGCSRGIGRAIAAALLAQNWRVVGMSRTYPECFRSDDNFEWHHADVRNPYQISMGDWRLGERLDALVHCAGIQGPAGPFEACDDVEWLECLHTNLTGTYNVLRTALPYLTCSDDGRALLFAGGGAFNPRPNYSAYAASKAGVVSLMETVAAELAPCSNVTVNCVSPGYVPTSMTVGEDAPSSQMDRAVGCVLYLLSPATRGLTGKTISAEYDDWATIRPETVPQINSAAMGTRHRYKVWQMQEDGSYVYRTDLDRRGVMV